MERSTVQSCPAAPFLHQRFQQLADFKASIERDEFWLTQFTIASWLEEHRPCDASKHLLRIQQPFEALLRRAPQGEGMGNWVSQNSLRSSGGIAKGVHPGLKAKYKELAAMGIKVQFSEE